MCRLLGIVSSEQTDFRLCLREAPRSLALLSQEHPHGWGVAIFNDGAGARSEPTWTVQKKLSAAHEDDHFHEVAAGSRGEVLVAHIRKATVGPIALTNTHPFRRGRWLFAHNGTIEDLDFLRARISERRMAEVEGDTDSELLFAHLLTRFDDAGVADTPASEVTHGALLEAARRMRAASVGACNFLLSDGDTLYAHCYGRTLYLLERVPGDRVRTERQSPETGAVIGTPWSRRRHAILLASERITDEPWQPIAEGTLILVERRPAPHWRVLG